MFEVDAYATTIAAILVLFLGKAVTRRVALLRRFNIPDPVTGGLLASLTLGAVHYLIGLDLAFDLELRDSLLVIFFATIGLSSRFATLRAGGRPLALLTILATVFIVLQNLVGIGVALGTGQSAGLGLLSGSVSLIGGHGTAVAWSPILSEQQGVDSAMEIGLACATFGLVLGGIVGGPLARLLITRRNLQASGDPALTIGTPHDGEAAPIDYQNMLNSVLLVTVSVVLGVSLNAAIEEAGFRFPEFVTALIAGILVINLGPPLLPQFQWPLRSRSLALVSDLSLGLFLAMSLLSLQLWTLIDLSGPLLAALLAQVLFLILFTVAAVFTLLGRDYDAAVMASGFAGLAIGATPTAIANMTAVTEEFGASPRAFVAVPLVGALFVGVLNSLVIQLFLHWL